MKCFNTFHSEFWWLGYTFHSLALTPRIGLSNKFCCLQRGAFKHSGCLRCAYNKQAASIYKIHNIYIQQQQQQHATSHNPQRTATTTTTPRATRASSSKRMVGFARIALGRGKNTKKNHLWETSENLKRILWENNHFQSSMCHNSSTFFRNF